MEPASPDAPASSASSAPPRTLIVGGGIAGLTLAAALHRRGVPVELVEQAPAFGAVGAGITVQANGSAVLDALGIRLPPEDVVPIGAMAMLDPKGRPLFQGDTREIMPEPPSLNIHRADLHRALLAAAEGVPLTAGRSVTGLTARADAVEVRFADGSTGEWALVIGADGLHSAVRRALLGDAACALAYSGQTCWRFAVEAPDLVPDVTIEQWMPGKRAGLVPMAKGCIYGYMVESAPEGTPGPGSADVGILREKFGGMHVGLDAVLERLDGVPIHHGDLYQHRAVHFGRGRVVLIGDAAHAMTPNLGQGAGTAIEDAGELVLLLAEHAADPAAIPAALDARRRARVTAVTRTAWTLGRVAHWQNPLARWLRDTLLRAMPDRKAHARTIELWRPGIELAARIRAASA